MIKRSITALGLAMVLLFRMIPVAGQTLEATADSYIHDANPSTNYGMLTELLVKKGNSANFRKAFIRFEIPAVVSGISSAVVRLYASSSVAVGMNVHPVSEAWTETGLTWNNAPAEGAVIATASLPAFPGYNEWDITSYVQDQFTAGDRLISLVFYSATVTSPSISFSSRQSSTGKPALILNGNQMPPAAPDGLTATASSFDQIDLSWNDNSDDETGFRIESREPGGNFALLANTASGDTTYSHTGLAAGTIMSYRVQAFNLAGSSACSNEATDTTPVPPAVNYYVDATAGNDNNNGLSPSAAWKTLAKVNATVFSAGNRILFRSGQGWTGRLWPKGSGVAGSPVIIDKYGEGDKPLIDGNGMTGTGVVYLYNQQHWEITNLEITNNAPAEGDRRGVRIELSNYGTARHIYLKDLDIHHIRGLVGQGRPEKRTAAIGYAILDVSQQETHFHDILVENCVITSCQNQGIITECVSGDGFDPYSPEWNAMKITQAVIRNNIISDISKNAMIIRLFENGVVEHNLCYNTANGISGNTIFSASCSGTVFQYNEGYANHSPDADGSMYDADLRSPDTYWQYSYSHDNAHGLFWTCTVQADENVVCRYNISQNDHGIIFCINYPVTSVKIYNNTVYIAPDRTPVIISERNNGGSGSRTYTFHNNIIYNMSAAATYEFTSGYNRTIDYNCFWGYHPSNEPNDPHKITANPLLTGPGSGGNGLSSTGGYKLLPGSPCINTGKTMTANGGKDFWGNPLYRGAPDIGAHEYTPVPATPSDLVPSVVLPDQIHLNWNDHSDNETGFRIERKDNAGTYTLAATVESNVTGFPDNGISLDTARLYRVCAFNTAGISGYTNVAQAANCWTGEADQDWNNPSNWAGGLVPEACTHVTISPAALAPVVSGTSYAADLRIREGASLTISPAGILEVNQSICLEGSPGWIFLPAWLKNKRFDFIRNPNE